MVAGNDAQHSIRQARGDEPRAAFIVSVARGLVISGILILLLPSLVSADAIWLAMPITELLTVLYAASAMKRYTNAV